MRLQAFDGHAGDTLDVQMILVSFLDKYTYKHCDELTSQRPSGMIIEDLLQFEAYFKVVMNNLTWLANS
jgi:hypothetical protein